MHIVIVGCGRVGRELAMELDNEGHSVAIVDRNRRALARLPERWSGRAVLGHAFDQEHLAQAGIEDADAFAALTSGDNTNIVSARVAREGFKVKQVVARIYDPKRAGIYERLGIATVASAKWTTDQAKQRLFPNEASIVWTDFSGDMHVIERALPPNWAGKSLKDLVENNDFQLISVTRAGKIRFATPSMVGQEGDTLHFACYREALNQLTQALDEGPH